MVARFFFSSEGGTSTTSTDFDTFGVPLIGVTVFFGLGFESLTGVSGTVAALAASLLMGVVFGTSWKVHG